MFKKFFFILFFFFYIFPFYIQYKNKGIFFSGNVNLQKSYQINDIDRFFQFSFDYFFTSLNIFNNGIFYFFISALVFQLILRFIK